jgi:hypothetical protein
MNTNDMAAEAQPVAPEVPWGENGIDTLIWADTEPYAELLSPAQPKATNDHSDDELL